MKRVFFISLIIFLLNTSTALSESSPAKKLNRGLVNILTASLEVPKQARSHWIKGAQKTDHILVWIFSGTVYGMIEGVKRTGSGMWDVLSFPLNIPQNHGPLLKPDTVFDEWPRNPVSGR